MGLEKKNAALAALQAQSANASLHSLNSQEYVEPQPFLSNLPEETNISTGKQIWPLTAVVVSCLLCNETFCLQKSEPDNDITAEIKCQFGNLMGGKADGSDPISKKGASAWGSGQYFLQLWQ